MKTILYGGAQIIKDTNRSRAPGFLCWIGTFTPITWLSQSQRDGPTVFPLSVLRYHFHCSDGDCMGFHFHASNLNGARKLQWEKHSGPCQRRKEMIHWSDREKKIYRWGWGKQQQIRGLLHYYLPQGMLPQSRGTRLKRARPWFLSPPPDTLDSAGSQWLRVTAKHSAKKSSPSGRLSNEASRQIKMYWSSKGPFWFYGLAAPLKTPLHWSPDRGAWQRWNVAST